MVETIEFMIKVNCKGVLFMNIGPSELHDLTMFSLNKTQFPSEFNNASLLTEAIAKEYVEAKKRLQGELKKNGVDILSR